MVRPWKPCSAHQLDRRLVGLGARVGEEDPSISVEQYEQSLGELDLALVQEQVGRVRDLGDLAGDRLDEGRMGVSEGAHRDPGDQVQVFTPLRIPYPAARPSADRDRRHTVVRHQGRREPFLQFLCLAHG
jgi:hypothetical protein